MRNEIERSSTHTNYGTIDVSPKPDTLRVAISEAIVTVSPGSIELVKSGKIPKGSVVDAAILAGTLAAKRASDLIPFCHPIPIDDVKVNVTIAADSLKITSQVKSIWKTGVEMESLTSVAVGALTIYDMLKPVDDSISIGPIKLIKKEGGTKQASKVFKKRTTAILVTSDSRDKSKDKSGKLIFDRLESDGYNVVYYEVIPDKIELIMDEIRTLCDKMKVDLILTCGGTGIGSRDVTPDATLEVIDKEVSGIADTLRAHGQRRTPYSMLSRGVAGVRKKTVIINLPGSPRAISESLDPLLGAIHHAFEMLENHKH
jgi:cyclic pyranopterin monophosphate synthase